MHARHTIPDPSAGAPSRHANRVAARPRRLAASTYRPPSVVLLRPGPLHKLAWIFGLR